MPRGYWLFKSEPSSFSIADLRKAPGRRTNWDGVRNYRARNTLRDEIRVGDGVLFYHSNADPPAVVGTAVVVETGLVDPTQFDATSRYYDPDSDPAHPRWTMVTIELASEFAEPIPLAALRGVKELSGMELLRKGSRLSVQPVSREEWRVIVALGGKGGT